MSDIRRTNRFARPVAAALIVAVTAGMGAIGCSDVLDVEDPDVVTPDQLEGPTAVPTLINGMIRDFQEAYDDYVRYASMFTDEMILAGTFQGRVEVDDRRITPENQQITGELYEPIQRARQATEDGVRILEENLDDPAFSDVRDDMLVGRARGNLFAGYLHVILAEMYCNAVVDPEGPALSPDEVMAEALTFLEAAESQATSEGIDDVATAARVGRARANLWLGNLMEASELASTIPSDFVHLVEYSNNTPDQNNELAQFTWGFTVLIRWTVGDGRVPERNNERFAHLDEWISQGLINPDPGDQFSAQNASIPVVLQLLHDRPASNIVLASGWEARMIEAEVELRTGDPEVAQGQVNDLLTDPSQSANPMLVVNPDLEMGAFDAVDFTGNPSDDLPQLARARNAGLWLTGERQATFRRFIENDGVDLYPDTDGDDICFPIVQQEIDNNPNL